MELPLLKNDDQAEGSRRGKLAPPADEASTKRNSTASPLLHSMQLPYLPAVIRCLTKQVSLEQRLNHKTMEGVCSKVKCCSFCCMCVYIYIVTLACLFIQVSTWCGKCLCWVESTAQMQSRIAWLKISHGFANSGQNSPNLSTYSLSHYLGSLKSKNVPLNLRNVISSFPSTS